MSLIIIKSFKFEVKVVDHRHQQIVHYLPIPSLWNVYTCRSRTPIAFKILSIEPPNIPKISKLLKLAINGCLLRIQCADY